MIQLNVVMTKVILHIPSEKVHSFLNAVVKLGIKENAIQSNFTPKKSSKNFPFPLSKFVLFDWEFFSNELEFE